MKKVIQIIREHLVQGCFDGLVLPEAECGCTLDDLAPCESNISDCRPGYKGAERDSAYPDYWCMYTKKEAAIASLAEAGVLDGEKGD